MFQPIFIIKESLGGPLNEILFSDHLMALEGSLIISINKHDNGLREKLKSFGHISLHPRFSPSESAYLQAIVIKELRRTIEKTLLELDDDPNIDEERRITLLKAAKKMKHLIFILNQETLNKEILDKEKEINDFLDILLSRLMKPSVSRILEVTLLED